MNLAVLLQVIAKIYCRLVWQSEVTTLLFPNVSDKKKKQNKIKQTPQKTNILSIYDEKQKSNTDQAERQLINKREKIPDN